MGGFLGLQFVSTNFWKRRGLEVRSKGETKYLRRLSRVYYAHQHSTNIWPSTDLITFQQTFHGVCWISSRIGWGKGGAPESRLAVPREQLLFPYVALYRALLGTNIVAALF